MRDLLRELLAALAAGRRAAWCRLVETRGSTPQKAGAAMLVYEDGSQAGTLGGGCVEAEVKRRALALVSEGRAEVCTFQLDSDYGWDDGLICGGRMKILVQPLSAAAEPYFRALVERTEGSAGCTEALVFDAGSGLPLASSFLLDENGQVLAKLGVPPELDWPAALRSELRPLSSRPQPYVLRGIALLPLLPRCRLVIVGGGHVGKAVADLAAELEFDVWVVDDRPQFVDPTRFPKAQRRISGPIDQVLKELDITPQTYCLIVTRGHNHDQEALLHLADRGAAYVGLIGSRRKIKLIFQNLLAAGVPRQALKRVYAPLGVDIGSQTVPEIAVSICAELIAHRNRGTVPGRPPPIEF